MRQAAKQLNKFLSAFLGLSGVSVVSATSVNVTAAVTTLLGSAGDGGRAVPVQQASATQMGLLTSGNNVVEVWDNATLEKLVVAGEEVYGRLTFASPNYVVSFFTDVGGVETAQAVNQSVRLAVPYRFDLDNLPQDSLVVWQALSPGSGAGGVGGVEVNEPLTVTANDTISNIAHAPLNPTTAKLTVNGQVLYAGTHFTITGQAVTRSAGQITATGFSIATTDDCVMQYRY